MSRPVLALAATLLLAGCNLVLRETTSPIPTRSSPMPAGQRADTLVVFLPGRGGSMNDFAQHGFITTLLEAGIRADSVAVDAHLNYYMKRTVIDRLDADVIAPARRQGYRRIVVVGVSLGGLGALLYEREHPGVLDAIVLLAPYLGDKDRLFTQIAAAGGPATWAAGRDQHQGAVEEQLWTFLGQRSVALPATWLLAGQGDSLATGHRLLATLLPATRARFIPGAHDWQTWKALWQDACVNSDLFAREKTNQLSDTRRPVPAAPGNPAQGVPAKFSSR